MIVNSIGWFIDPQEQEPVFRRKRVEIPAGSWAVIMEIQTVNHEGYGIFTRSEETRLEFIGAEPNETIIRRSKHEHGRRLIERIIYWTNHPFAAVESWENPIDGKWVHLATRVGRMGLTRKLPRISLPKFFSSRADMFGPSQVPSKWCRLVELAERVNLEPSEVIKLHHGLFEGYDRGLHIVKAPDVNTLTQTKCCENLCNGRIRDLIAGDLRDVWVRKRFALVVGYLQSIQADIS